jgi:DnaJ domain
MQADYYQILGIPHGANVEQIRQAYRTKAKLYHPDINKSPNAKIIFQLINEAYQVLINPEKKKWYDFKLRYPSTTGGRPQPEQRRTASYESYYRAYTRSQQERREEKEFKKYTKTLLDNVLFYFLVFSGVAAIIFSIMDIWYSNISQRTISGFVFGFWFLFLLFYGWNAMNKK